MAAFELGSEFLGWCRATTQLGVGLVVQISEERENG
jgi:hypothetical protein